MTINRVLKPIEMMTILAESNCPICNRFILVSTMQTEEHIITSNAYCSFCAYDYSIDRSYPAPFEILSGHAWHTKFN